MYKSIRLVIVCLFCVTALMPTWSTLAQNEAGLLVFGAWARPTVAAVPVMERTEEPSSHTMMGAVSAAYMTIENRGNRVYRLVAATSTAADIVEIHQTSMVADVMQMRPVTDGIEIADGMQVALEPGGYHIMLMDLTRDFVPGEAIMLTLLFDIPYEDGLASGTTHTEIVGVPILEQAPESSVITIEGAWARPTVSRETRPEPEATPEAGMHHETMRPGSSVSAAYLTLINHGIQNLRLVDAQSTTAAITEIHETSMENDVMRMRPVEGIDLPAGGAIKMEPGGYHIMMLDLQQPLIPGEAIVVRLEFDSGDELVVAVPVYDPQTPVEQGETND